MKFVSGNQNGQSNSHLIMGIINLAPDSFFPGSRTSGLVRTLEMAEKMVEEGADILDIGAESSRPGSKAISVELELERLMAVVPQITRQIKIPVSIDTYKPLVAKPMLDIGASIINDITGLRSDPEMAKVIAQYGAGVVIMHMQGNPETMQANPKYEDVVQDIILFLKEGIELAQTAGIDPEKIALDPGIGFGKTSEHNLEILRRLEEFQVLKKPILLGASRKSFIGSVLDLPVEERLEGSLAAALIGLLKGAAIFRVHDVKETVRAVKMSEAILNS